MRRWSKLSNTRQTNPKYQGDRFDEVFQQEEAETKTPQKEKPRSRKIM